MKAVFEDTGSTVSGPWVNSPLRRSGPRVLSRSRPAPVPCPQDLAKESRTVRNSAIEKGEREREKERDKGKRRKGKAVSARLLIENGKGRTDSAK